MKRIYRYISDAIMYVSFFSWFPFVAIHLNQQWGGALTGTLLSLVAVLSVIISLYVARLADYYAKKKVLNAIFSGYLLAALLFVLSFWYASPVLYLCAFSLLSWSFTLYFSVSKAIVSDAFPASEWKRVFSALHVIFNVAFVVGPLLGGLLANQGVWHAGIMLAATLVNMAAHHVLTDDVVPPPQKKRNAFQQFYGLSKDYRLSLFLLGSILAAQAFMQLELLLPVTIEERLRDLSATLLTYSVSSVSLFTLCMVVNGALIIALTRPFASLSDRYSLKFAFCASGMLYGLSMVIFAFATGPGGFMGGVLVLTLAELLVVSVQDTYIATISPEDKRSSYFAAASIRFSISRIFAPQMLFIAGIMGNTAAFLIVGFIAALSAVVFMLLFSMRWHPLQSEEGR
ncbi:MULTISPECIES: MFS transporter [Dickeya]|uniref:Transport protein n=1 Tax=Dickeya aquatica TaxID=1401087 RepID=A0A375AG28_9GAMM|nr:MULTISPECIES: MFS transporter [Dickeya]SLM65013.1 Putative transport protein [Dickeya aquatica]